MKEIMKELSTEEILSLIYSNILSDNNKTELLKYLKIRKIITTFKLDIVTLMLVGVIGSWFLEYIHHRK